jgi:hypothetical protein
MIDEFRRLADAICTVGQPGTATDRNHITGEQDYRGVAIPHWVSHIIAIEYQPRRC